MPKTFLYANASSEHEATPSGSDRPEGSASEHRDKVRILVIGRPTAINRVILEMSHVGFSDSIEWSKAIPTDRQRESMRVLTRYVFADS
ncbi:hypothetical protein [Phormidium tenue]|uniref:Peptide ABC transporter substrate-binding protein n=1 Tax=Phormidium tenue NIES-30 TaxID=549789 RepID=A0A1U7J0Q6_9CYAN|nr:hypothetical protein [Phormidium tenue]MBD2234206.1 hypothetical protein [Phormidium tenue FACHB-1052]OKH45144.1 hypothetical protein NIES30_20410 [Phormidium tenue NIES-30]